jgi:hypothetical protein
MVAEDEHFRLLKHATTGPAGFVAGLARHPNARQPVRLEYLRITAHSDSRYSAGAPARSGCCRDQRRKNNLLN